MGTEESIIRRVFPVLEQAIADAGDLVAPDLVQLQHDIVEWAVRKSHLTPLVGAAAMSTKVIPV